MGFFYISTAIAQDRVDNNNQPPLETIELESFLRLRDLINYPFAETVRFSDYLRQGGEPVRYYHLTTLERGLAISIPPSGQARVLSGLYINRTFNLVGTTRLVGDAYAGCDDDFYASHLVRSSLVKIDLPGSDCVIARINCVESFPDCIVINASLRVPEVLLKGGNSDAYFEQILCHHASMCAPSFEPLQCSTIDCALIANVPRRPGSRPTATLQFSLTHSHNLPLLSVSVIGS